MGSRCLYTHFSISCLQPILRCKHDLGQQQPSHYVNHFLSNNQFCILNSQWWRGVLVFVPLVMCASSEWEVIHVSGGCVMGHRGRDRCKKRGNGNNWVLSSDKDLLFDLRKKITLHKSKNISGQAQTERESYVWVPVLLLVRSYAERPLGHVLRSVCCIKCVHHWLCN